MKVVYASRMGKVEKFVEKLNFPNPVKINDGTEIVAEDFLLITYTDGNGIVPPVVETFLKTNNAHLKGVAVSGNSERHPQTFCAAAELINSKYGCPIIAKFEGEGDESALTAVKSFF